MRHGDKINNLGRTASHRRALLANMAISLIDRLRDFLKQGVDEKTSIDQCVAEMHSILRSIKQ